MFPMSSAGVFEDPSTFFEQDKFLEDLLVDFTTLEGTENGVKKRPRKVEEINEGGSSNAKKKTAHRFNEKQRRQEMTALYASLRSLLPLECIKGKRSISDHMQQAVNYINDTKKKIEEIKVRRDSLRKRRNAAVKAEVESSNIASDSPYCVKINMLREGLEVLISSSLKKECFPLSMVLGDLLARQLHVINCVSTRGDRCYLHTFHIELNDPKSIDLSELQEGLVNVLKLA